MSPSNRDAKKHAQARQRRYLKAQERLARDCCQAQQAAEALEQALQNLGLPEDLVAEIEGRLRSQHKLLGKIVGMMCPPLFGCRTNTELCRVRGWDKNLPTRLLGALPKRSWLKRLRRLGLEVLGPLWRYAASKSEATRSRWQWTWVGDDSVFKKYGEQWVWWVLGGVDRNTGYSRVLLLFTFSGGDFFTLCGGRMLLGSPNHQTLSCSFHDFIRDRAQRIDLHEARDLREQSVE
jgi:hypothetical protein